MPWKKIEPMNERVKFIAAYLEEEETFSDLCKIFEISRKTGYKWIQRYEEKGLIALADQSRAPHSHPHAVSAEIIELILAAREKHKNWGPKKLLVVLRRKSPNLILPVPSTVGQILKRSGCIKKRRRRVYSAPNPELLREYAAPNAVWCADFKGHFPVGGKRCNPLTISDGFSRYLLRCEGLKRPLSDFAKPVFESAFREYGLPDAIRTDNGAPFSTLAPGGLSRLAIWWIKLGIRPERIMPGRPDQNGRHERMHRTLKAEAAHPPRANFKLQQKAFDTFKREYNHVRPHEALAQQTPASAYQKSFRPYPKRLLDVDYPSHFKVFKTYPNGVISFNHSQWITSSVLKDEWVGLEEVADDRWKVYFGPVPLGIIDVRLAKARGDRLFGSLVRLDGEVTNKRGRKPYRK
jgi:transposase InsO family protein